ncbi:MAG: hypothetical protein WBF17_20590, partial [Phycisphaerae bacterium]
SGDGESVFLKYFGFDRSGKRSEATEPHLFAIAGLLGEEWFVRSYWVLGSGMPPAGWGGWASAASMFPAGRILCFDKDTVYGYGRQRVASGPVGHKADAYHLFSASRKAVAPQPTKAPQDPQARRKPKRVKKAPAKTQPIWADAESLIVRAMALGGDRLAVAGPVDLGRKTQEILAFENEPEALAGFKGHKGVYLRIVGAADGKKISQCRLTQMPVFDGLAAGGGRIYLSLKDGSVACFGK